MLGFKVKVDAGDGLCGSQRQRGFASLARSKQCNSRGVFEFFSQQCKQVACKYPCSHGVLFHGLQR